MSLHARDIALRILLAFVVLLSAASPFADAGTTCTQHAIDARELAAAAASAQRVRAALEQRDAPVALLARHGQDLSRYGLFFSHVGIVVRDHPDGRWTVVHLLNSCGTSRSGLYAQGLVNFFADDLVDQDARIVWLKPELAQQVLAVVAGSDAKALHQSRYSVIARYDSRDYQNSTAWVLDVLAAAELPAGDRAVRSRAQAEEIALHHVPDTIHIAYGKRILGGLFSANTVFTDHPVAARLSGEYRVVTVRSILRWLDAIGATDGILEWRHGIATTSPGPA